MTEQFAWLIESPIQDAQGPYYLCVSRVAGCWFEWKPNHQRAIRFSRKEDADAVRDAVRELQPDLFPSIMPFPQAVEHGWSVAEDASASVQKQPPQVSGDGRITAFNPLNAASNVRSGARSSPQMSAEMATLVTRLKAVPLLAFLRIPTATPLIDARIPIGELCHEAAASLQEQSR